MMYKLSASYIMCSCCLGKLQNNSQLKNKNSQPTYCSLCTFPRSQIFKEQINIEEFKLVTVYVNYKSKSRRNDKFVYFF